VCGTILLAVITDHISDHVNSLHSGRRRLSSDDCLEDKTVLCCVVCNSCVWWYPYTWAVLLIECWNMVLGLFSMCWPFCSCVCFCCVSFSSVLHQHVGYEEHLRNDLFYVDGNVKPELGQSSLRGRLGAAGYLGRLAVTLLCFWIYLILVKEWVVTQVYSVYTALRFCNCCLFGVVLASDSQYEGSNAHSFRSLVVDEERMVTGWRQCFEFTLTLLVGWQEGHPAHKKSVTLIAKCSVPKLLLLLPFYGHLYKTSCLQCFDTVGWAAGRASGL